MSLKYAILGLLEYRDLHGYRLKELIERDFGYMWAINYGQLYPMLKKMGDEGLISTKKAENAQGKGPPRKLNVITDKGRAAFREWLGSPPEKDMLLRDPFLMRFVFFGFGDREKALELIQDQREKYVQQLDQRKNAASLRTSNDVYVNQTAQLGIQMHELFIEWLDTSREKILEQAEPAEVGKDGPGASQQ